MIYKFLVILVVIDLLVGLVVWLKFRKTRVALGWIAQALMLYAIIFLAWRYFKSSSVDGYITMGWQMAVMMLIYLTKLVFGILASFALISQTIFNKGRVAWSIVYILTSLSFCGVLYGITVGRYDYKITHRDIIIEDLPKNFEGLKLVHFTDLHLGSYALDYKGVDVLVEEINSLKPDLVLFSGDMVNSYASEMEPWIEKLSAIKSKYGNFAVTGNHDHGDHAHFSSAQAREDNLQEFFKHMKQSSFTMLNNDNYALSIGSDSLYICGVMNYGHPPFSRWGKLDDALAGTDNGVKILLSHNPTHWRDQIVGSDVALTLSGHTHAMQMGVDLFGFKWSPSQYIYDEYDGLYSDGKNQLNVSRGVGYLGMAGRIGLRPEIVVLNLYGSR